MSFNYLRYLYLAHFSKPVGDRSIYRAIRRVQARRILEIGIGSAGRTVRLIGQARRGAGKGPVRYAAIDLFEARPANGPPGMSLKETHRRLAGSQVQTQLIPGHPAQTVARVANSLANMDLVVISADYDAASLGKAWFYLPRMLHERSQVYLESRLGEGAGTTFRLLARAEIDRLASTSHGRRAA